MIQTIKKSLIIGTIIFVILFVLFLANFVIYQGIKIGFMISSPYVLFVLKLLLSLLSLGFVGFSILAAKYNNFFTRLFYYITATWLGCMNYLFFDSAVYIILASIMGPSKIIVTIIFGCAIIIICYGILHAQNIKIKKIPIKIASIPESWKGQKAVLISDLHLGQIYGKKFVTKICSEIKKINPAIIFIVGDIFDGVAVNAKEVLSPFSDIAVPLGIYFVTGNHEEFSSNLKYFDALRNTGIKILNDEMVNFKGMQIIGVDYKTTTSAKNFKNVLDSINIDSSKPSILLKHTPSHINITEEKGISLQLSGHTHRAQIFPFNFLTPLIYKGFDYGLKKSKNTQVLISSGIGTWGPPLRVGTDSEIVIINFV